jgi:hypothetical protein
VIEIPAKGGGTANLQMNDGIFSDEQDRLEACPTTEISDRIVARAESGKNRSSKA